MAAGDLGDSVAQQTEHDVDLAALSTFGLPAQAATLVHIRSDAELERVLDQRQRRGRIDDTDQRQEQPQPPLLVLGGGSNTVFTGDVRGVVLKMEVQGMALLRTEADAFVVEAGAGVPWAALVEWTLAQGLHGLENLALIPGTVGGAVVQNIGAYGLELAQRFLSLDMRRLEPSPSGGGSETLDGADCEFGYRHSVFKGRLAGRAVITRVRLRLPRPWAAELSHRDLQRASVESGQSSPDAKAVYEWVCALRRAKLPDPAIEGNAGSFFKNPVVTQAQLADIARQSPDVVFTPLAPEGSKQVQLAAGWLVEACGWKGRAVGGAAVSERHALVLVNRGQQATGMEVVALAEAIQQSVHDRFGVQLAIEPVII